MPILPDVHANIVVTATYKVKDGMVSKDPIQTITEVTEQLDNRVKITTKKINSLGEGVVNTTSKVARFRSEFLSLMFAAAGVSAAINGLTSTSMAWAGVNEVMSTFLGVMFLPLAFLMLKLVMGLWKAFSNLPGPVKYIINALAGFIGLVSGIGVVVAMFGLFNSALVSLGFAGAAAFAPLLLAIAGVIIVVAALWWAFNTNFLGIRDTVTSVMDSIQGTIQRVLDIIKLIWEGKWGDAWLLIRDLFVDGVEWLRGIGGWFYDAAKGLIDKLIKGIESKMQAVRDAFWNLLPDWLKKGITMVGYVGSAISGVFGGMFDEFRGRVGMASGGIVTRPTNALIGENGPEAVIPLDRIGSIGGVYVTINTSTVGGNIDSIVQEISDKLLFQMARSRY